MIETNFKIYIILSLEIKFIFLFFCTKRGTYFFRFNYKFYMFQLSSIFKIIVLPRPSHVPARCHCRNQATREIDPVKNLVSAMLVSWSHHPATILLIYARLSSPSHVRIVQSPCRTITIIIIIEARVYTTNINFFDRLNSSRNVRLNIQDCIMSLEQRISTIHVSNSC